MSVRGDTSNPPGLRWIALGAALLAGVAAAGVLAAVLLTGGSADRERAGAAPADVGATATAAHEDSGGTRRELIYSGVATGRGLITLPKGIVAHSDGSAVTALEIDLTLSEGGDPINLDPETPGGRVGISYEDETIAHFDVPYTVRAVGGDDDLVLEPGEVVRLTVDLAAAGVAIPPGRTFTLRIESPAGSRLVIQRGTPAVLPPVFNLH